MGPEQDKVLTLRSASKSARRTRGVRLGPLRHDPQYTHLPMPMLRMGNGRRYRSGIKTCGTEDRLFQHLQDGMWNGRRCFVVGGGESLKGFDWSLLKNELVIGVNLAFEACDPNIIMSIDIRFWGWVEKGANGEYGQRYGKERGARIKRRFDESDALKLWVNVDNTALPPEIMLIGTPGRQFVGSSIKEGIGTGGNSGYAAVNLACILKGNPVYLLGFDMEGGWWHKGHPSRTLPAMYNKYMSCFHLGSPMLKQMAHIYNLNPNSKLRCFEFESMEHAFKPIRRPLIISYYTRNTGYEEEIKKLEASVRKFRLEYDFRAINDLGSWQANTYYKAQFIREMMDRHPGRDLLWLDADAELCKYPILFDDFNGEFGVHYIEWEKYGRKPRRELDSAVMYLKNCPNVKTLVDKWVARNKAEHDTAVWEQKHLQAVIKESGIKVTNLPASYCQIFDLMAAAGEPVIEQHQASRRLRKQ